MLACVNSCFSSQLETFNQERRKLMLNKIHLVVMDLFDFMFLQVNFC